MVERGSGFMVAAEISLSIGQWLGEKIGKATEDSAKPGFRGSIGERETSANLTIRENRSGIFITLAAISKRSRKRVDYNMRTRRREAVGMACYE